MKKVLSLVFLGLFGFISFAMAADTRVNVFFVNQGLFINRDAELAIYIDGREVRDGIDSNDDANFTVRQGRHTIHVAVLFRGKAIAQTQPVEFEAGSQQVKFRAILSSSLLAGARASNNYPGSYAFNLNLEFAGSTIASSSQQTADARPPAAQSSTAQPSRPEASKPGIEGAIARSCVIFIGELPKDSTIAVLSILSGDAELANFAIDELEYQLVTAKQFTMVDRKTLDTLRTEQNFQLSGDVSDQSAVAIGNMLGANIVITGSVSGAGNTQRLTLKALDVKTAQIITMAREAF
ncbi:hypothetical protein AGMMS49546_37360 [Spirochaetia bacterium]|nr:hypothetical protein AGMMS49546_37360 [Spirochaetia bacterium]